KTFALKAAREARLRTSWRKPDDAYEAALARWLTGVFDDGELVADIARFARSIEARGNTNSLAQLVIKLTAPGVPDIYQGAELADRNLVDPDNRRPVDFERRRTLLREITDTTLGPDLVADLDAAKLWTIRRLLGLRRRDPDLFAGSYEPLDGGDGVFAFSRNRSVVVVVPRGGTALPDAAVTLPDGSWRDVFTASVVTGRVSVAELWARFPVAVLVATAP
ncbi:MAG TPA: alpha amylase C-terminal domain-containing protein, partial [Kofleriaceae bacterium]|nr:alpha amylase C-terminal domain-containing protein [Kofleriaceae bacterium]